MNSSGASKNSRLLNSLLPLNSGFTTPNSSASASASSSGYAGYLIPIVIFLVIVGVVVTVMVVFKNQLEDSWKNTNEIITGFFGPKKVASPAEANPAEANPAGANPAEANSAEANASPDGGMPRPGNQATSQSVLEKILPGTDVFSVSSNKYTYYDAEPLCKALGAELATFDQVKDAWKRGADWCNYGWVKGQLAVYPTSDSTYQKLQAGPEEQRMTCGTPGVNGGFFDNPEMRFGVTCVGKKPVQSKHDEDLAAKGAPLSPDAFAFDKKVSQFKSDADHIGILPFNGNTWS